MRYKVITLNTGQVYDVPADDISRVMKMYASTIEENIERLGFAYNGERIAMHEGTKEEEAPAFYDIHYREFGVPPITRTPFETAILTNTSVLFLQQIVRMRSVLVTPQYIVVASMGGSMHVGTVPRVIAYDEHAHPEDYANPELSHIALSRKDIDALFRGDANILQVLGRFSEG